MVEKKTSNGDIGLPILIVFVSTFIGLLLAPFFNPNLFYFGLIVGFLAGILIVLTVEYASTKIRRN